MAKPEPTVSPLRRPEWLTGRVIVALEVAGVLLGLFVGWFLFIRSGHGLPDEVAGRPAIPVDLGREERLQLLQLGVQNPSIAAYGVGEEVEIGVLQGEVDEDFDLRAVLRSAAAFGGTRLSMVPVAAPAPWACVMVSGAARLWTGLASEARVCHVVKGSQLLAFTILGTADLAQVGRDLEPAAR